MHPIYFTGNFKWRKISGKLSLFYHNIDDEERYLAIAILFFVTVSSQLYIIASIPFFHGRCENEIISFFKIVLTEYSKCTTKNEGR